MNFKNFDLRSIIPITRSEIYALLIILLGVVLSRVYDLIYYNKVDLDRQTELIKLDSIANIQVKAVENPLININFASIKELRSLPGIGEKTALKILEYRKTRRFKTIHDIKKVKGIGDKKFEKLKEFIEVNKPIKN